MYCSKCGSKIPEGSEYCIGCGEQRQVNHGKTSSYNRIINTCKSIVSTIVTMIYISMGLAGLFIYSQNADQFSDIHLFNNSNASEASSIIEASSSVLQAKDSSEIADMADSVLMLEVYDQDEQLICSGSGFIVFNNKTLITNYHVISGMKTGYSMEAITQYNIRYKVEGVVYCDPENDVAVLKLEAETNVPVIPIGDSSTAFVGDAVYVIGSPLGLKNTLSSGIISAIREVPDKPSEVMQISAPISPGSSGGVMLNKYGQAIGIVFGSYTDGQNLNLAIPSRQFTDINMNDYIERFDVIATKGSTQGNSTINTRTDSMKLVEYGEDIFYSYSTSGGNEIIQFNRSTEKSTSLGLYGDCLNINKGILYFRNTDKTGVSSYNIDTREYRENAIKGINLPEDMGSIEKLFVSNSGMSIIYTPKQIDDSTSSTKLNLFHVYKDASGQTVSNIINGVTTDIMMLGENLYVGVNKQERSIYQVWPKTYNYCEEAVDFEPVELLIDSNNTINLICKQSGNGESNSMSLQRYNGLYSQEKFTELAIDESVDSLEDPEYLIMKSMYPDAKGIAVINGMLMLYEHDELSYTSDGLLFTVLTDRHTGNKRIVGMDINSGSIKYTF